MLPTWKTEEERQALKVKTACCKACGGWISQACFPYCETSKESVREFARHAKAGDTIDVMTVGEAMKLYWCVCAQLKEAESRTAKNGDLFSQPA